MSGRGYLLRFASVGVVNTLLGYAIIFFCMYVLHLEAVTSNVIGYGVGLVTSYVLNRNFTFRSTAAALPEAMRFLVIFCIAYASNLGILVLLTRFTPVHAGMAQVVAGAFYFGISFVLSKYYVFGKASGQSRS